MDQFSVKIFFFFLEITIILERKFRNHGSIFSKDFFFRDHHDFGTKILRNHGKILSENLFIINQYTVMGMPQKFK